MDIRDELLAEHSKSQTAKVVNYVGDDAKRFVELMRLFVGPVYRESQRAAWAVSNCIERHPDLVKPYWKTLIEQLERPDAHVAVRRNVVRLLQFVEIPKRWQGRVFDACFNLFADIQQPVAVRCFSLSVAANIAKGSEALMNELRVVAVQHPETATAGIRSRTRRILGV
ncbi:MAG TPA: hypothetical protein PKA82_16285 [Pyrinomonadaceae bacterium]|nr:hypothetical protein [Pyrinomonadaceae bacterium]